MSEELPEEMSSGLAERLRELADEIEDHETVGGVTEEVDTGKSQPYVVHGIDIEASLQTPRFNCEIQIYDHEP